MEQLRTRRHHHPLILYATRLLHNYSLLLLLLVALIHPSSLHFITTCRYHTALSGHIQIYIQPSILPGPPFVPPFRYQNPCNPQLLLSCLLYLTARLFDHLLDPISSIPQEVYPAYHRFESRRKTCNRPLTRSSTRTRRGCAPSKKNVVMKEIL